MSLPDKWRCQCACGCGVWFYAPRGKHRRPEYVNEEHYRVERNRRYRMRRAIRKSQARRDDAQA